jgi:hypothetical protein
MTIAPRCLSKQQAAEYCGCESLEAFDAWIRKGIVPPAIHKTRRWDKNAIDAALDRASGLVAPSNHLTNYQRWKADREGQA